MKKYGYLILGLACVLTACGAKEAPAGGSEAVSQAESAGAGTLGSTDSVTETSKENDTAEADAGKETDAAGKPATENNGETDRTAGSPLNVELSGEYDGEWQDGKALLRSKCATIYVLDEGFEELKAVLKDYNENNCQEVKTIYTENLEWVKESPLVERGIECYITREIELTRADDRVLSFWNREESYLGGAHSGYYANGEAFDAGTGKSLALSDIAADHDGVVQYVKDYLNENYDKNMFFEDYEDTLETMFYGAPDEALSPLEWVMGETGVTISFSPYVIAPWAASEILVEIPYAGNEALWREEYRRTTERPARRVMEEERIGLDVDGAGAGETVWFQCESNKEAYSEMVTLFIEEGSGEAGGRKEWNGGEFYGEFADAWLMETKAGHPYLYLEFKEENDWERVEIFDLAAEGEEPFRYVEYELADAFYGHFISDPENFALYARMNALGTYMGYRSFAIGEDGVPVPLEDAYRRVFTDDTPEYSIVSKRELCALVWDAGESPESGKKETLPAKTGFTIVRTDEKTFAEAVLADGRMCRLELEKYPDDYQFYIDGVSEYECFEELPYAG